MKVLMFSDYFAPHIGGGVEHVVDELSRRLAARGHSVHVLTYNTEGVARVESMAGYTIHRSSAIQLTRLLRLQSTLSIAVWSDALRLARELQPDILHAHNLFFSTSLVALAVKATLKRPLVTTLHLGAVNQLGGFAQAAATVYEQSFGRLLLRGSDGLTAVSQAVATHGQQLAGRPIAVIPNGVDTDTFRPTSQDPLPGQRPRIALVGRLIFNKGPHFLVDAAPRVLARHPAAEFVIIGDGPLRPMLEATIRERGLGSAFTFLGLRQDVATLLPTMTMLVRPSLSEGLPLTVLEAMACGLPVVATPVGGTAEVVQDGLTGRLIEPGSSAALAEAINELLDEPERAAQLGAEARAFVQRGYTWERATDETLALYRQLLGTDQSIAAAERSTTVSTH